jgi:hypothetical protein
MNKDQTVVQKIVQSKGSNDCACTNTKPSRHVLHIRIFSSELSGGNELAIRRHPTQVPKMYGPPSSCKEKAEGEKTSLRKCIHQ